MHQYMGNLMYRGIQPSEIKAMGYGEMLYWNRWHKKMADEEKKTAAEMTGKRHG